MTQTHHEMVEMLLNRASELGLDCAVRMEADGRLMVELTSGTVYLCRAPRGEWRVTQLRGAVRPLMDYVGSLTL